MIEYCSGTLMYANQYPDKHVDRKAEGYEAGVKSVGLRELPTYIVHIKDDMSHIDGKRYHAWIVPAESIYCVLFITFSNWKVAGLYELCKTGTGDKLMFIF